MTYLTVPLRQLMSLMLKWRKADDLLNSPTAPTDVTDAEMEESRRLIKQSQLRQLMLPMLKWRKADDLLNSPTAPTDVTDAEMEESRRLIKQSHCTN